MYHHETGIASPPQELQEALLYIRGKDVFIACKPDVLDWTSPDRAANLVISGGGRKIVVPFPKDEKGFRYTFSALKNSIGGEKQIVIGWNLKNLFSYFLGRSKQLRFIEPGSVEVVLKGKLYDLKIIESFAGVRQECPKTFDEAFQRLQKIASTKTWERFQLFYRKVYIPLMTTVVPDMETSFLTDISKRGKVYSFYELEGQVNGRMKCKGALRSCFVPHNMTDEVKRNLRIPSDTGLHLFMYFDYSYMEVSVLQWLSGDEKLAEILATGTDLYEAIWEEISGIPCNEKRRRIAKGIFLPVTYNQGYVSLAKKLEISEDVAKSLIDRLHTSFPTAFRWIRSQKLDSDGIITDCFGRRRYLDPEEDYKARNFVVQAPAALICLSRLVRLYYSIRGQASLVFSVHDGYGVIATSKTWKNVYKTAITSLETECDLFPGLRLRIACQTGQSLDKMSAI